MNLPSSVVSWMGGGRGLVPIQQYVTFSETCVVTRAFIGRVLYTKLWFLRVLFKQCWVSLFPLISPPVLVNYLPVGLYFTSPEALSTLIHFWKPLFSKTSGFQKTDKKICIHTSIFISYLAVHNRDWKWRSKDAFCYQAMLEQFLCPNTHAWCPKTLKACQISFAHVKVKHTHDYDITPFWKPPFSPFTLEW